MSPGRELSHEWWLILTVLHEIRSSVLNTRHGIVRSVSVCRPSATRDTDLAWTMIGISVQASLTDIGVSACLIARKRHVKGKKSGIQKPVTAFVPLLMKKIRSKLARKILQSIGIQINAVVSWRMRASRKNKPAHEDSMKRHLNAGLSAKLCPSRRKIFSASKAPKIVKVDKDGTLFLASANVLTENAEKITRETQ